MTPQATYTSSTGKATYTAPATTPGTGNLNVMVTATAVADVTRSATSAVTVRPPIAPSLAISFVDRVVHSSGGTLTPTSLLLTAVVNNAPSGTPPTIDWTQSAQDFCVSSDEESGVGYDGCGDRDGDSNEPDGPGRVVASANTVTATYFAPLRVFDSATGGVFHANKCPLATNAAQPYVYVTASTVVNGSTLNASACIRVSP